MPFTGFLDQETAWAFFEGHPMPCAFVAADGRFLRVNDALCDFLGYAASHLERLKFQRITHPDDLKDDEDMVRRLLANPAVRQYSMTKAYLHARGFYVGATLYVRAIWKSDGTFDHFVSWIVPLPNHGRFKTERTREGDAYVRPVVKLTEFVADNWKLIAPAAAVVGSLVWWIVSTLVRLEAKLG